VVVGRQRPLAAEVETRTMRESEGGQVATAPTIGQAIPDGPDTEGHNTMALQLGWDPLGERRREAEQAARDRAGREMLTEKRGLIGRLWAALSKAHIRH
jgi:hypothetical protein